MAEKKGTEPEEDEDERHRALATAAEQGDVARVRDLLATGADPNWANAAHYGETALHRAAFLGRGEVLALLIDHGGRAGCVDRHGAGLLHKAGGFGQLAVVRLLVERHGLDVHAVTSANVTPLQDAARGGHGKVVKYLLFKGADPKHQDFTGKTALSVAEKPDVKKILEDALAGILPTAEEIESLEVASKKAKAAASASPKAARSKKPAASGAKSNGDRPPSSGTENVFAASWTLSSPETPSTDNGHAEELSDAFSNRLSMSVFKVDENWETSTSR